jgi:hypothetical protein
MNISTLSSLDAGQLIIIKTETDRHCFQKALDPVKRGWHCLIRGTFQAVDQQNIKSLF